MNKKFISDRLFPTVVFEAQGGNYERFLSACVGQFVPLSHITATPYGFTAQVPAGRYTALHPLARAAGCRLRVRQKRGWWFALWRMRHHAGVLLGLIAAFFLSLLMPAQIWNIEYYGVAAAQQQELSDRLFRCGVYQGCFVTDELLHAAAQQIMLDTDSYADVSLNYGKGRLVVEARPVTQNPDMYLPQSWDIIATQDGVIRSVEVYSGVGAVQPGQTVQKGDVLVKSTWQDQQGVLQPAPCRARIMAYVEKTYTAACPLMLTSSAVTQTKTDSLALCFGSWRLWLKKGGDPDAIPTQQGVKLLGMALPCTLYRTVSTLRQPQTQLFTQAQAESRCKETMNAQLYQQLPSAQVLSREYSFEVWNDVVYGTMQLRAYADIVQSSK